MNKRQWQVLAAGLAATVAVPALATQRYRPPIVGPVVQVSPGLTSQTMLSAHTPGWAMYTALGLALLTGGAVYGGRTRGGA